MAVNNTAINKNIGRFSKAIAENKSDLDVAKLAADAAQEQLGGHLDKETNQRILNMIESA